MAPLSILPGRLRLESSLLRGRRQACRSIVDTLRCLDGVREATASFRTGRLLVRFDENLLNRLQLTAAVEEFLLCGGEMQCRGESPCPKAEQALERSVSGHLGRHLLVDLITHAVLPSPLDLLLTPAMAVLRR